MMTDILEKNKYGGLEAVFDRQKIILPKIRTRKAFARKYQIIFVLLLFIFVFRLPAFA